MLVFYIKRKRKEITATQSYSFFIGPASKVQKGPILPKISLCKYKTSFFFCFCFCFSSNANKSSTCNTIKKSNIKFKTCKFPEKWNSQSISKYSKNVFSTFQSKCRTSYFTLQSSHILPKNKEILKG